jgi:hypothetical protein
MCGPVASTERKIERMALVCRNRHKRQKPGIAFQLAKMEAADEKIQELEARIAFLEKSIRMLSD